MPIVDSFVRGANLAAGLQERQRDALDRDRAEGVRQMHGLVQQYGGDWRRIAQDPRYLEILNRPGFKSYRDRDTGHDVAITGAGAMDDGRVYHEAAWRDADGKEVTRGPVTMNATTDDEDEVELVTGDQIWGRMMGEFGHLTPEIYEQYQQERTHAERDSLVRDAYGLGQQPKGGDPASPEAAPGATSPTATTSPLPPRRPIEGSPLGRPPQPRPAPAGASTGEKARRALADGVPPKDVLEATQGHPDAAAAVREWRQSRGEGAGAATPVVPGNINLDNRPVVPNGDGYSTVRSMSINVDGQEVLIPTVSDDGRLLSEEEAVQQFRRTGKHLGVFNTPEEATAYAEKLHQQQARQYAPPGGPDTNPDALPKGQRRTLYRQVQEAIDAGQVDELNDSQLRFAAAGTDAPANVRQAARAALKARSVQAKQEQLDQQRAAIAELEHVAAGGGFEARRARSQLEKAKRRAAQLERQIERSAPEPTPGTELENDPALPPDARQLAADAKASTPEEPAGQVGDNQQAQKTASTIQPNERLSDEQLQAVVKLASRHPDLMPADRMHKILTTRKLTEADQGRLFQMKGRILRVTQDGQVETVYTDNTPLEQPEGMTPEQKRTYDVNRDMIETLATAQWNSGRINKELYPSADVYVAEVLNSIVRNPDILEQAGYPNRLHRMNENQVSFLVDAVTQQRAGDRPSGWVTSPRSSRGELNIPGSSNGYIMINGRRYNVGTMARDQGITEQEAARKLAERLVNG